MVSKPDELKMVSTLDRSRLLCTALFLSKAGEWCYGSDMWDIEGPEAYRLVCSARHITQAAAVEYHSRYVALTESRERV